jgi:hypothetical protein
MYLKKKEAMDCNGVERYCQKMIEKQSIEFYPI